MASNTPCWIECNNCPAGQLNLSLTECGHLYCQNCLARLKSNNNKCLICTRPTSYQILDELSDEFKEYFKVLNVPDLFSYVIKFRKIHKFQESQMQLYVRNKARKELMTNKRFELLINDLKACKLENQNFKKEQHQRLKFTPNAPSITGSKMSTPESNVFMTGILKGHSGSMMTSTPHDRNMGTPQNHVRQESRATPIRTGTPTHFITPKSMNGSAEQRQQRLLNMNQRQEQLDLNRNVRHYTPSYIPRSNTPQNYKLNSNQGSQLNINTASGIPIRQSHSEIKHCSNMTKSNPALMSYKKLIHGRTDAGNGMTLKDAMKSGLSSGSQSTSSLQMKNNAIPNLNMSSFFKRKRT